MEKLRFIGILAYPKMAIINSKFMSREKRLGQVGYKQKQAYMVGAMLECVFWYTK